MDLLKSLFEQKDPAWWEPVGLVSVFFAIWAFALVFEELTDSRTLSLVLCLILSVLWVAAWALKQRVPRVPQGSVGILIAIHSQDREVDRLMREDFIASLQASLKQNDTARKFHIEVLPQHIAKKYTSQDDGPKLLHKSRAHHLLLGKVRKRQTIHTLDLHTFVRHSKLTEESTKRFRHDISSAWINRYNLKSPDLLLQHFELTSELVSLCSRYIIGTAAFASKDWPFSRHVLERVRSEVVGGAYPELPQVVEIRRRVADTLNTISCIEAQAGLKHWAETREQESLEKTEAALGCLIGSGKRTVFAHTTTALVEVALNNNLYKAQKALTKIKPESRDAIWHLNHGFLRALQDDDKGAIRAYDLAAQINESGSAALDLAKISEFEDFIFWYRQQEDCVLLILLAAMLNWDFKGDGVAAKKYFSLFIEDARSATKIYARTIAESKLEEIDSGA